MARKNSPTPTTLDTKRPANAHRLLNQRNAIVAFAIVGLIAIGVFIIRTNVRSTATDAGRANAANAELVARGKQVYATRCASCHGGDLKGEQGWPQRRPNGVMPASPLDERGPAPQHDDQWLFSTIKLGGQATAPAGSTSYMPAFGGGLKDEDIWAVISYIKSTWPQHMQDAQPHS